MTARAGGTNTDPEKPGLKNLKINDEYPGIRETNTRSFFIR
jgi:hypothetical protein